MIDIHNHPIMIEEVVKKENDLLDNIKKILSFYFPPQPLEVILLEMDAAGIDESVLLPLDCTTAHGCSLVSNEIVIDLMEKNDRFYGFSSVDPRSRDALIRLEKYIDYYGLKGLKLDPSLQLFSHEEKDILYPLYQYCSEKSIPVMIHCGLSWSMTASAKHTNPLLLEETIHDFPELKIIIPHFGWPWINETLMLALKYKNVYIDSSIVYSGTPTQVFKQVFENQIGLNVIESSLMYKLLFGSNYPRTDMRRTVRGLEKIAFSPDFKERFYKENTLSLLKAKEV